MWDLSNPQGQQMKALSAYSSFQMKSYFHRKMGSNKGQCSCFVMKRTWTEGVWALLLNRPVTLDNFPNLFHPWFSYIGCRVLDIPSDNILRALCDLPNVIAIINDNIIGENSWVNAWEISTPEWSWRYDVIIPQAVIIPNIQTRHFSEH